MEIKNKIIMNFFLFVLFIICPIILNAQSWELVWADEFNGSKLDQTKWNYHIGNDWDLLHYNTDREENVKVNNGKLQIIARKEPYKGFDYTAALLHTAGKGEWCYGRIEARMKLPGTTGFCPAFWLIPAEHHYGWWPSSGEIDIMEHPTNDPQQIHGTVHTEDYNLFGGSQGPQGDKVEVPDAEGTYHVYAIDWNWQRINFYVDDIKYYTFTNQQKGYKTWPFDQAFHIRLAHGVGGGWAGPPDENSVFPSVLEIDYVRVYQSLGYTKITGPDYLLQNSKDAMYIAPEIKNASYDWKVTSGASIISGQSTNKIFVDWKNIGGIVSVKLKANTGSQSLAYPVRVSTNFLGNPGFEKGVKYWNKAAGQPASATHSLTTTEVRDGAYSMHVNVKKLGNYDWDVQISQGGLALQSGKTYLASFWAKADGSNRKVTAAIVDVSNYELFKVETFTLTTSWKKYSYSFTANRQATVSFNIDIGLQTGNYYFDDFVFTNTALMDPNKLKNGHFYAGDVDWHFTTWYPAEASGSVKHGEYVVSITHGGNYLWDINLGQSNILIEKGKTYHVIFDAYADEPREVSALVGMDVDPWIVYSGEQIFDITTEKRTYAYSFTMNHPTDHAARLGFDIGLSNIDITFDNIILVEDLTTNVSEPEIFMCPKSFKLFQNFPNPFNAQTTINYQLSSSENVILTIYNLVGEKVCTLVNEAKEAGSYNIVWDGEDDSGNTAPSGVYVYRFKAGKYSAVKKAVMIK